MAALTEGKRFLGLNKWAWVGVIALGVVVFLYFRHSQKATASPAQEDTASGAQLAPSVGGTPPGDTAGFDPSWFAALMDQNNQSLSELSANIAALAGSGVGGMGGGDIGAGGTTGGNPYTGQFTVTVPNNTTTSTPVAAPVDSPAPLTPGMAGYGYGYGPGGSYVVPGFSTFGDGTLIPAGSVVTPELATSKSPTVGHNVAA